MPEKLKSKAKHTPHIGKKNYLTHNPCLKELLSRIQREKQTPQLNKRLTERNPIGEMSSFCSPKSKIRPLGEGLHTDQQKRLSQPYQVGEDCKGSLLAQRGRHRLIPIMFIQAHKTALLHVSCLATSTVKQGAPRNRTQRERSEEVARQTWKHPSVHQQGNG